jgi:hypothetical protein
MSPLPRSAPLVAAALTACLAALAPLPVRAAPLNIESFGAVASVDSYAQAVANGVAFAAAMNAANNGSSSDGTRSVLVQAGSTYWMLPAAPIVGLVDVTLLLEGTLSAWTANTTLWPGVPYLTLNFIDIDYSTGVTITGGGTLQGNGYGWWWEVLITGVDGRPNLLGMWHGQGIVISNITMINSPQYHALLNDQLDMLVEDVTVYVNIEGEGGQRELLGRFGHISDGSDGLLPAGIPTFPLNTDGIDVAGSNITIRRVNVTNFDDAICMKPLSTAAGQYSNCTQNVLVEDSVVQLGVGMSVGSVTPHPNVACIRNVTFQRIVSTSPIKGIYIKPNPGTTGTGIIDSITYQDITMTGALWWSIYVGLQQQEQPGNGTDTGCSFFYPLANTTCPTQPLVPVTNLVLRNVSMTDSLLSPGLLRCNASGPCTGWVFENVTATSLTNWPVGSGYLCAELYGTATNSFPAPTFAGPTPPAGAVAIVAEVAAGAAAAPGASAGTAAAGTHRQGGQRLQSKRAAGQ